MEKSKLKAAKGWAVFGSDGTMSVKTVSPYRRAALVNFLVAAHIVVTKDWTDKMIELAWEQIAKSTGAEVHEVDITPAVKQG